jgi:endonuclease V-like protein UPF0215 family
MDAMTARLPHVLGIDDAPFEKDQDGPVPIVGVVMSGAALVEGIAVTSFPVDGDDAAGFLGEWVSEMRWRPALRAVVLGGVTVAGLGIVDLAALAARLTLPVISVTRRAPTNDRLVTALRSAGLSDRLAVLDRLPPARRLDDGLFVTSAGTDDASADELVRRTIGKANVPEPLRIAHLIGAAIVQGSSRGGA